jgi:hypothetical protein
VIAAAIAVAALMMVLLGVLWVVNRNPGQSKELTEEKAKIAALETVLAQIKKEVEPAAAAQDPIAQEVLGEITTWENKWTQTLAPR